MKLIGIKIYRTGPLKLFKNGWTSEGSRTARKNTSRKSSTGSTGSTPSDSWRRALEESQKQKAAQAAAQQEANRKAAAQQEANRKAAENKAQQEANRKADAKKEAAARASWQDPSDYQDPGGVGSGPGYQDPNQGADPTPGQGYGGGDTGQPGVTHKPGDDTTVYAPTPGGGKPAPAPVVEKPVEKSWWESGVEIVKNFFASPKKPKAPARRGNSEEERQAYQDELTQYDTSMKKYLGSLNKRELGKLKKELERSSEREIDIGEEGQETLRNINEIYSEEKVKKIKAIKRDIALKNKLLKAPNTLLKALYKKTGLSTIDDLVTDGEFGDWINEQVDEYTPSGDVVITEDMINEKLESGAYDDVDNPDIFGSPESLPKPGQGLGQGPEFARPTGTVPPKLDPNVKTGLADLEKTDRREKLLDRLESIATGKTSMAKEQMKAAQEQSLKQRLSQMQSMRGAPTAAKMRMFDRAQDESRRELAAAAPLLSLKERKEADYIMSQMLDNEANRDLQMDLKKMSLAEKEALRKMSKDEAIAQGKGSMWLSVAKESWKLFGSDIKQWYKESDFFGDDTEVSFDDTSTWNAVLDPSAGMMTTNPGANIPIGEDEDILEWFRKNRADGGSIDGPGTETSDSIPARLSDGEFVLKASAVRGLGKSLGGTDDQDDRKKGVDFLYKLQDKMDKVEKYAEGGEAYVRPKRAFREAIGYESESRFHDKAEKDAKFGGARRKFRHFQDGGPVDFEVKPQFKVEQPSGYGSVIAAQGDLNRRLEELERKMGR